MANHILCCTRDRIMLFIYLNAFMSVKIVFNIILQKHNHLTSDNLTTYNIIMYFNYTWERKWKLKQYMDIFIRIMFAHRYEHFFHVCMHHMKNSWNTNICDSGEQYYLLSWLFTHPGIFSETYTIILIWYDLQLKAYETQKSLLTKLWLSHYHHWVSNTCMKLRNLSLNDYNLQYLW